MNPKSFDNFKNENLAKTLIMVNRIGQACFAITALAVVSLQLFPDVDLLGLFGSIAGWTLLIGIACFTIIGLAVLNKTNKNTAMQSTLTTLRKIFLYMFLPAMLLTAVLVLIFVVPRYN